MGKFAFWDSSCISAELSEKISYMFKTVLEIACKTYHFASHLSVMNRTFMHSVAHTDLASENCSS